jgi:hypothetical protein
VSYVALCGGAVVSWWCHGGVMVVFWWSYCYGGVVVAVQRFAGLN